MKIQKGWVLINPHGVVYWNLARDTRREVIEAICKRIYSNSHPGDRDRSKVDMTPDWFAAQWRQHYREGYRIRRCVA